MNCDVGEATEGLENELRRRVSDGMLENELQAFRRFTYVTTHSPTLLHLRHSSFSNPASPTSQFILQPFFRFSYVTSSSLTSPGEPPMSQTQSYREVYLQYRENSANRKIRIDIWQPFCGNIRSGFTQPHEDMGSCFMKKSEN